MDCPFCRKGRLKRLRTFIEGDRVRRENICPKCHQRPVTIEMHEVVYLRELRDRDAKLSAVHQQLVALVDSHNKMQGYAKMLFNYLLPTPEPAVPVKTPKKAVSAKKTRKKHHK